MQTCAVRYLCHWSKHNRSSSFPTSGSEAWVLAHHLTIRLKSPAGQELSPTLVFDYPATTDLAAHLTSLLPAAPPQTVLPAAMAQDATSVEDAVVTITTGAWLDLSC